MAKHYIKSLVTFRVASKKMIVLVSLAGVLGLLVAVVATSAQAERMIISTVSMKGSKPVPTCPAPYVFSGKKASCVPCPKGTKYDKATKTCGGSTAAPAGPKCITSTDAKGVTTTTCVSGVQASANDIDTGRVTILGYIQANGLAKTVIAKLAKQGKCFWVGAGSKYPNFTNSGAHNGAGKYGKFADNRKTYVCRTGKGPSGIQKAYDINPRTGQKEHFCANYIWLRLVKNLIKGKVEVVRNLGNVLMHLHAESHVRATSPLCPGTYAEGFGQADVTITLNEYMRTRGPVSSSLSASAYGKATSSAKAGVVCAPGTTTTQTITTPGTTTTVPVTTTTPPTTTTVPVPSPTIRVQQIQELYPNETRPLCANVKNVPSGGGTVDFTVQDGAAPKGTVSPASKSVSSGDSQVCVTYQAPASTGTNQYFATLKVGGKQVDQDSLWVEIIAQPSNP